ncbi:Glyoxalase/bleomycin resistance protein/dioxygenase [Burkholderia sp. lig30]|jgi:catechol 2,3-dioxygenase-like lactoylglutathione lyase family enzyme|uniref:VOC family protein n=1 Tax=Burkholderia sp. lig30 TaxID=1192124 RepID=UPI0004610290|nr:VOC family protein [Burkholderia sp. lig30]KDB08143.1 Glyoxalase/bleomycin resistance protein/dioxygenase [Burkholderia sp. lig30]
MIRSLHHVGVTVPNLEVGRAFYEIFGLDHFASGNDLVFRCADRANDQIRLIEGSKKKLTYISFGTNAEGMKVAKGNLGRSGVTVMDSPFPGVEDGIWFQDPDGLWVNLREAEPAPSLRQAAREVNAPGHYRRQLDRVFGAGMAVQRVRPRRLGHLIKFTPDVRRSVDFYTRLLGMKESDRSRDIISFLRCSNGGDHHTLAFAKSSHVGFHHLSFEVDGIDEIELGARTLIEAGYKDCFGLGRHVAGSNFFHYIRDPWNSLVEMFWDMDMIPEDDSGWEILDGDPEDVTAVWAKAPPPEDFVVNFETMD